MIDIDWKTLKEKAQQASQKAYAPYSKFHVGAALLTEEGDIFQGCNVENASYGLTVCAERNALSNSVVNSGKQVIALAVYTAQEKLTPPCGACRQVIAEFMKAGVNVASFNHLGNEKFWTVEELLPDAFLKADLDDKKESC